MGGGSAGSALANRLSAAPSNRVLVLEAGRNDSLWDLFIHMPAGLSVPIGNSRYDWCYESEPEADLAGRRVSHARGKLLGGSSSINGMIFIRGNALDFQRWAREPGMEDWGYANCLPYFRRMENRLLGGDRYRGTEGPLRLETGPGESPLFPAFLKAAEQAGYARTDDINGFQQEGFGLFDRNIYRGRRLSAARAYLHPVRDRSNLEVICRAFVSRINFEGKRATGIDYTTARGDVRRVRAGKVILAGGAINSPQLLQLSGVGSSSLLSPLGIEVIADLPGVGENLQDHLEVYVQHRCARPVSMMPALFWARQPWIGLRWLLHGSGPAATNHFEAGGFVRSDGAADSPNIQYHFLPLAIRYDGTSPFSGHGYQVHVGPTLSDARGDVRIRSTDPRQSPAMRFNYLSTPRDRREWLDCLRITRKILAQPAFEEFDAGEISPGPDVASDEEILDWVARDAETALHPSCTCKMGTDPMSVVDPVTMDVHGLEGLAVVDASVMPSITNGNIYAPTMMIAERAADLILGNTPLAADLAPFPSYG